MSYNHGGVAEATQDKLNARKSWKAIEDHQTFACRQTKSPCCFPRPASTSTTCLLLDGRHARRGMDSMLRKPRRQATSGSSLIKISQTPCHGKASNGSPATDMNRTTNEKDRSPLSRREMGAPSPKMDIKHRGKIKANGDEEKVHAGFEPGRAHAKRPSGRAVTSLTLVEPLILHIKFPPLLTLRLAHESRRIGRFGPLDLQVIGL
ncbi:hypothetical protein MUK42_35388 [Musa troglodytarum]|uniref:Uncharacterized protein n=1 Tax=Musa troglodytarum TaxID=320322 RepID=A0A9E7JXY0_9LILI|nr:hypothetical protein MUK42_35388 [Musa troglodytarum]